MAISMKAFMKEELKERGTMEFEGIERFKDESGKPIPFIIKQLSKAEQKEIRNRYKSKEVFRDKKNNGRPFISANGRVAILEDYDSESAGLDIMVEAFVQPKLDDPALMEYYGIVDRLEMPQTIFPTKEDYQYAENCLMEALGLTAQKKDDAIVDELKN